mmetsp:Transcript_43945/g.108753  ORF Transcript_43945/g.108753 Transcript_43945/m.108753 type:complete len:208 (-) Transcript_43945:883-1506(-)
MFPIMSKLFQTMASSSSLCSGSSRSSATAERMDCEMSAVAFCASSYSSISARLARSLRSCAMADGFENFSRTSSSVCSSFCSSSSSADSPLASRCFAARTAPRARRSSVLSSGFALGASATVRASLSFVASTTSATLALLHSISAAPIAFSSSLSRTRKSRMAEAAPPESTITTTGIPRSAALTTTLRVPGPPCTTSSTAGTRFSFS